MLKARIVDSRGISMMEMMIAVVIVGLLAAIALPTLDGILSSFRLARSSAITLQEPHGVYFDTETGKIVVFADRTNLSAATFDPPQDSVVRIDSLLMPSSDGADVGSMIYTGFPNQTVVFYPDGRASATGDVYLHRYDNDGMYNSLSIYVTAATGRARLEFLDG
jgi:prepilin-type N-terminal cleavage/methylation domain-containing protein